jgi:NTE family protein
LFHDTLKADVEQTQRVTKTLRNLPRELAASLPYRAVDVLAIQPTHSLDALAQSQIIELPEATRHALGGAGRAQGRGRRIGQLPAV